MSYARFGLQQAATTLFHRVVPAHSSVHVDVPQRLHAFVMHGLSFMTDWADKPAPWYWRNLATRWVLRKLRRKPPRTTPPIRITIKLADIQLVTLDAAIFGRSGMYRFCDMAVLILGPEKLEVIVSNDGEQHLLVLVQAHGNAEPRHGVA